MCVCVCVCKWIDCLVEKAGCLYTLNASVCVCVRVSACVFDMHFMCVFLMHLLESVCLSVQRYMQEHASMCVYAYKMYLYGVYT